MNLFHHNTKTDNRVFHMTVVRNQYYNHYEEKVEPIIGEGEFCISLQVGFLVKATDAEDASIAASTLLGAFHKASREIGFNFFTQNTKRCDISVLKGQLVVGLSGSIEVPVGEDPHKLISKISSGLIASDMWKQSDVGWFTMD